MAAEEVVRALRAQDKPDMAYGYDGAYKWSAERIGLDAADLIESLQTQLTETQRQLREAVGSLKKIDALCVAFRDTGASGLADMFARDVMEISGQDAGEGEAE